MATITKENITTTAKKTAFKASNAITNNPALIGNILVLLAVGVGGFFVYKLGKRVFGGDPNIDDNINVDVNPNTSLTTITNYEATIFAQQLLDAMNVKQPLWGTDEETILNIFQQINADDFKLIFNAFERKDYNGYNSPPSGFWSNFDSYEKRNLVYWLKEEINPNDGQVYTVVKSIIEQAGFVF